MNMHYARFLWRGGCGVLTYCGYEGGVEGVLAESEQQTCLTDSTVSDQQQFEQVIVRLRHLVCALQRFDNIRPCGAGIPRLEILSCLCVADWQQTDAERCDVKVCFALWSM